MNINSFTIAKIYCIILELGLGYILIYVLGRLILIPGKNKLLNVNNKKGQEDKKHEIRVVRRWVCLGWTLIIAILNILLLVF